MLAYFVNVEVNQVLVLIVCFVAYVNLLLYYNWPLFAMIQVSGH
jgi:hypothetical protein